MTGTKSIMENGSNCAVPLQPSPPSLLCAGMVRIPLSVPTLATLRSKFSELAAGEPHLGAVAAISGAAGAADAAADAFERERYVLGQKVILANHAPLSQEFLKRGAPHSLRGRLWAQVIILYKKRYSVR